jgi:septum formation protein
VRGSGITRLVLASASPRRRELLTALGVEFEVVVPEVEELSEGEPREVVAENALRKARAGLDLVGEGEVLVLGVDTDVSFDGALMGKAADEREARARLVALSARTHEVLSGIALIGPARAEFLAHSENNPAAAAGAPAERVGVASSLVTFKRLDDATLSLYLASGEWEDRAGAYAVQGLGSILVEKVQGDVSNVIGLPLALLLELAPELGKSM